VDNLQFVTNLNPQGPLMIGGPNDLVFATAGFLPDITNNFLAENVAENAALDIISGQPAGDNHTAIAVELATTAEGLGVPSGSPVTYHVSIYDKNEVEIGKFTIPGLTGSKVFAGFLTKDPAITIGRIDIHSAEGYFDGISAVWALRQPPPVHVNFFLDQGLFEEEANAQGKVLKTFWDFKPDHLDQGVIVPIDDVLDITTHSLNAPGVWDDGTVNLWPSDVDNVQFSANLNPQGPWEPHGPSGLYYAKVGWHGIGNNALGANYPLDSLDLISGPPAGDNHTAMALKIMQLPGYPYPDPVFHISVYDKANTEIGKFLVTGIPGEKLFLGIITKDPDITIGRVDIWDESGGPEGISSFGLYSLP
jgi:hypothetical protein